MRATRIVILAGSVCLSPISAATAQPQREADQPRYMTYRELSALSVTSDAGAVSTDEPVPWMEMNTLKAIEIQDALHGEGR